MGFVGLGQMGSRMVAALLHAGQQLVVCDQSAEAVNKAEALGAETVSSPAAVASSEGKKSTETIQACKMHSGHHRQIDDCNL